MSLIFSPGAETLAFFVETDIDVWTDFESGASAGLLNGLIKKQHYC
jgi:hypothetical protein